MLVYGDCASLSANKKPAARQARAWQASNPGRHSKVVLAGDLGSDLLEFATAFQSSVGSSQTEWTSAATSTACDWSGVVCNATTSTFALDLGSKSLAGNSVVEGSLASVLVL